MTTKPRRIWIIQTQCTVHAHYVLEASTRDEAAELLANHANELNPIVDGYGALIITGVHAGPAAAPVRREIAPQEPIGQIVDADTIHKLPIWIPHEDRKL